MYFGEFGRSFPWRSERDPYRLAIAEILLQKTRASSVVATYGVLIELYPEATDLASAEVAEIERLLMPLGLSKKRSTQLTAMARAVVENGAEAFEDWRVLLRDVPGLGAYAARAIATFGRGEKIGIVDANVARIIRRIFRIPSTDPRAVVYQQYADEIARASKDIRATNFGLLDIGAAVCLPRPDCDRCPFAAFCPQYGVRKTLV